MISPPSLNNSALLGLRSSIFAGISNPSPTLNSSSNLSQGLRAPLDSIQVSVDKPSLSKETVADEPREILTVDDSVEDSADKFFNERDDTLSVDDSVDMPAVVKQVDKVAINNTPIVAASSIFKPSVDEPVGDKPMIVDKSISDKSANKLNQDNSSVDIIPKADIPNIKPETGVYKLGDSKPDIGKPSVNVERPVSATSDNTSNTSVATQSTSVNRAITLTPR